MLCLKDTDSVIASFPCLDPADAAADRSAYEAVAREIMEDPAASCSQHLKWRLEGKFLEASVRGVKVYDLRREVGPDGRPMEKGGYRRYKGVNKTVASLASEDAFSVRRCAPADGSPAPPRENFAWDRMAASGSNVFISRYSRQAGRRRPRHDQHDHLITFLSLCTQN